MLKSGENLSINLIICTLAAFADFKSNGTIDEERKENYLDQQKLKMLELIWSLCAILLLDSPVGDIVITQL
jgi:hypothetical protein